MTVRLGLTMGDPAGIGPEIVLKPRRATWRRASRPASSRSRSSARPAASRRPPAASASAPRSRSATTRSPGRRCR